MSQKAVNFISKISPKSIKAYLTSVRGEFKKIHWTSKSDLIQATKLVLVATLVFGLLVFATDVVVRGGLGLLKAVFRMICG